MWQVLLNNPQFGIILLVSLLFALTLHEFGHAYVAFLCGDMTAKNMGRMNINPLAHLDLVGSLMLVFIGFGYAKPVPVNPRNYRYKNGDFYVSAAGPGMNLLLTILGGLVFHIFQSQMMLSIGGMSVGQFIYFFMYINMNLCLFNLIPLGPLDGSYVLTHFLPIENKMRYQMWNMRYGTTALMILVMVSFMMPGLGPFSWIPWMSQNFINLLVY